MAYGTGNVTAGNMSSVSTSAADDGTGAFIAGPGFGDGRFNLSVGGTFTGAYSVERMFPATATWFPCTAAGAPVSFTAPLSEVLVEPEPGTRYRIRVTSLTSGTLTYRFSQQG